MLRPVSPPAQALREARRGLIIYDMVWIDARNRQTGAIEGVGFWTGGPSTHIAVTDMWTQQPAARLFLGFGGLMSVSGIRHKAGTTIRPARIALSAINEDVLSAIMAYQLRGAQVQVWLSYHDPETGLRVGSPEPQFKGYVNEAPVRRPASGDQALVDMTIVSTARNLTITSRAKKSQAALEERNPGDKFRIYKAHQRTVEVPWGERDNRNR